MFRPGFSRLFLTVAMFLALSIAGLAALVLHWSETWTLAHIDREVEAEIGDLSAFYEQRRLLALKELVEERSRWRPALGAVYLLAYRKSGERLGGNVTNWPAEASFDRPFAFTYLDDSGNEAGARIRARAVVLNNAFTLLVGRSLEPRMALVRDFQKLLPFLAAAVGMLGLAAAFIIGRMLLARLEAINATARAVEAGQMLMRAPGFDRNDEIGELARNVNRMLDRINLLVDATRSSSDRIAHELRTPMTRLRAQLQQAAGDAQGRTREKIEDALDETRKLSAIFDALLDISRIEENSVGANEFSDVDIRDVVNEVAEFYAPAAEDRGIELHVNAPASVFVRGDRVLLQRLVANLMDNAIKFSPDDSATSLALESAGGTFTLTIRDSGPGMDADFSGQAFNRFTRGAASQGKEGFGLGLAIAKAIVRRHGFEISAVTLKDGLAMTVTGPAVTVAAGSG